ncbi:uncharacterized protein FOMMEDRAFT_138400 [Fomitiporia mediterranea MF3/22]|uniref:uncharacterized protein n=1 Tax=Fomitiporia mediterranea (strain MF3/22) TaxID=694068 RepID=UPI0004407F14|nr:uncharacterized protein FOMMEDRAFT_138400 [Fomitiporia mediterranea MF3/22]EJD06426.1 hypothetical protein FOMMEDRAFT_138400 [Fomitiporia mediterranea MF3/22]
MFRRWRRCNPSLALENSDKTFSDLRTLVGDMHTPGAISDANFDVVESRDADRAFEIDCDEFKWRWDAYLLGPKTSADVISKHLILPLISLAHVSFYSADPVSELEDHDLEKTVDRIGRAARRSVDVHVKHTLARPKIATTLQRISSLFGLADDLPHIISEEQSPDLKGPLASLLTRSDRSDETSPAPVATNKESNTDVITVTNLHDSDPPEATLEAENIQQPANAASETESDGDDNQRSVAPNPDEPVARGPSPQKNISPPQKPDSEDHPSCPTSYARESDSDSPRPMKKLRRKAHLSESNSDSESGRKIRSPSVQNSSTTAQVAGRGVRQPIKRGGRRF